MSEKEKEWFGIVIKTIVLSGCLMIDRSECERIHKDWGS